MPLYLYSSLITSLKYCIGFSLGKYLLKINSKVTDQSPGALFYRRVFTRVFKTEKTGIFFFFFFFFFEAVAGKAGNVFSDFLITTIL